MATLTNTKIKDTYDGLLKTNDNGVLGGTLQTITDGLGNNSALSLSTSGASVGGTLAVSGAATLSSTLEANAQIKSSSSLIAVSPSIVIENKYNYNSTNFTAYKTELFFNGDKENRYSGSGAVIGNLASIRGIYSNTSFASDADMGAGALSFSTRAATSDTASDVLTERMRIDSSGHIDINGGNIVLRNSTLFAPTSGYLKEGFIGNNNGTLTFAVNGLSNSTYGQHSFQIRKGDSSDPIEAMRIDSSGRVGIGTSSPTTPIHILSSTDIATFESSTTGLYNAYKNSNKVFGYVGTGSQTVSGGGANDFGIQSSDNFLIATGGGTERMRITSGGDVLIGTTSTLPSKGIAMLVDATSGIVRVATNTTAADALCEFFNPNGKVGQIVTTGTATSYVTSSDYRLKEDWQPMANALDRVEALKPINFAWKADGSRVDGFLAHELQEVVPEAVTGEKDATEEYEITPAVLDLEGNVIEEAVMGTRDVYQGIDQSKIVPLLVAAIQELKAEIELLKN